MEACRYLAKRYCRNSRINSVLADCFRGGDLKQAGRVAVNCIVHRTDSLWETDMDCPADSLAYGLLVGSKATYIYRVSNNDDEELYVWSGTSWNPMDTASYLGLDGSVKLSHPSWQRCVCCGQLYNVGSPEHSQRCAVGWNEMEPGRFLRKRFHSSNVCIPGQARCLWIFFENYSQHLQNTGRVGRYKMVPITRGWIRLFVDCRRFRFIWW